MAVVTKLCILSYYFSALLSRLAGTRQTWLDILALYAWEVNRFNPLPARVRLFFVFLKMVRGFNDRLLSRSLWKD